MPPKTKIDKQMIIDAAIGIIRESGAEKLNTRAIAEKLRCSTQPVLYHFRTMEEIKQATYMAADEFHSAYLMKDLTEGRGTDNPMKTIGTNYIRFGYEEKNLFRFLMQSDVFSGQVPGLFDDERLMPVLSVLAGQTGCSTEKAKQIFAAVYYPVHGIASLLANNSLEYNEAAFQETLDLIFAGVLKESEEK